MPREYYVVDAFASEPFTGNPAAVLLDGTGLDDQRMQAIAAEFNLSETTFILPTDDHSAPVTSGKSTDASADLSVRFRWFTPRAEMDMCGHATIAGVHALVEAGRLPEPREDRSVTVSIDTRVGRLTAFVERIPNSETGRMIWLDLKDPTWVSLSSGAPELGEALGIAGDAFDPSWPPVRTQDDDLIALVRDAALLNDVRPDFTRLAAWMSPLGLRGLSLATVQTLTPSVHVQSRFFAPTAGINEDPVTGSVHGPLAAYLVEHGHVPTHDGIAGLTCVQGVPGGRTGMLHALVQPKQGGKYGVRIGGRAVTTMRGKLFI